MASLFAPGFPSPGSGDPGDQNLTGSADSTEYVMGTAFTVAAEGTVTAVLFYVPSSNQPTNSEFGVGLFNIDTGSAGGTVMVHDTVTAPTAGEAGTWKTYTLSTPQAVVPGVEYRAAVRTNRYAFSRFVFDAGPVVNGDITGMQDDGPGGFPNGAFEAGPGAGTFPSPNSSFRAAFYGIDVVVAFDEPVTGTLAATLPALTAAAAGTVTVAGALGAALPALDADMTAALTAGGPLAVVLPALTGSVAGQLAVAGELAAGLPALTAALVGQLAAGGPLAVTLPALTAALRGSQGARTTPRLSAGTTPRIAGGTTPRG